MYIMDEYPVTQRKILKFKTTKIRVFITIKKILNMFLRTLIFLLDDESVVEMVIEESKNSCMT